MCVIVYKPTGVKMPTIADLKACFKANPDGAGYMLPYNNKVVIRKGFMTYDEFQKDILTFVRKHKIDPVKTPVVLHFRITTQGGVSAPLCHPYPICTSYDQMRKLHNESDVALVHNGIISLTSESEYPLGHWDSKTKSYVYGERKKLDHNDTMKFVKDYASLIIDNDPFYYKNPAKVTLLSNLMDASSYSKLAIMSKNGHVQLVGKFANRDGVYYSNLYSFNSFRSKYYYDDDDNCYYGNCATSPKDVGTILDEALDKVEKIKASADAGKVLGISDQAKDALESEGFSDDYYGYGYDMYR